jgi:hypothetical protein
MSRLAEILKSGRAPGFNTKALDPGCPKVAVPRALRKLEEQIGTSATARACQYSVNRLKGVWFEGKKKRHMKTTLTVLWLLATLAFADAQGLPTRIAGNTSYTNSLIAANRDSKLLAIRGYNATNAVTFVQVYEYSQYSGAVTNGISPRFSQAVAATSAINIDFGPYGVDLNGVVIVLSQSPNTNTISAATAGQIQAILKR